jgi:hypothetical protein
MLSPGKKLNSEPNDETLDLSAPIEQMHLLCAVILLSNGKSKKLSLLPTALLF